MLADRSEDDRQLKLPTVIDEYTRECLATEGSPAGREPRGERNGYMESFNGKLRDELVNRELLLSVPEARYVLDEWRQEYNERRPHSGLNWQTPAAFAAAVADPPVGAPPLPAAQPTNKPQPILP